VNSLFCRRVHIHALPGMEVHELVQISGVNLTAVGFGELLVLTEGAFSHQFADLLKGQVAALFRAFAKRACGGVQVVFHGEELIEKTVHKSYE